MAQALVAAVRLPLSNVIRNAEFRSVVSTWNGKSMAASEVVGCSGSIMVAAQGFVTKDWMKPAVDFGNVERPYACFPNEQLAHIRMLTLVGAVNKSLLFPSFVAQYRPRTGAPASLHRDWNLVPRRSRPKTGRVGVYRE
jgi:hypothetical protein